MPFGYVQAVEKLLTDASEEDKQCWAGQLDKDGAFSVSAAGADFSVTAAMVSFKPEEKKVTGRWAVAVVGDVLVLMASAVASWDCTLQRTSPCMSKWRCLDSLLPLFSRLMTMWSWGKF